MARYAFNRARNTTATGPAAVVAPAPIKADRTVLVHSTTGTETYLVTVLDSIVINCTCKGYQYRKACKHAIGVQSEEAKKLGIDPDSVALSLEQERALFDKLR